MASTTKVAIEATLNPEAMDLLRQIRDRLPSPVPTEPAYTSGQAANVLNTMVDVLSGWIDSSRDNHYAREHRCEGECWNQFTAADIRNMIADTAIAIGIPELAAKLSKANVI